MPIFSLQTHRVGELLISTVAHLVEHRAYNAKVGGSRPSRRTLTIAQWQSVGRNLPKVDGSIPSRQTGSFPPRDRHRRRVGQSGGTADEPTSIASGVADPRCLEDTRSLQRTRDCQERLVTTEDAMKRINGI
jgi:hypothetical protein